MKVLLLTMLIPSICICADLGSNDVLEVNLINSSRFELICKPNLEENILSKYKNKYVLDKEVPVSKNIFCKADFALSNKTVIFVKWDKESVISNTFSIKDDKNSFQCKTSADAKISEIEKNRIYFISFEIKVSNSLNTFIYTYGVNIQVKKINNKDVLAITGGNVPMVIYSADHTYSYMDAGSHAGS